VDGRGKLDLAPVPAAPKSPVSCVSRKRKTQQTQSKKKLPAKKKKPAPSSSTGKLLSSTVKANASARIAGAPAKAKPTRKKAPVAVLGMVTAKVKAHVLNKTNKKGKIGTDKMIRSAEHGGVGGAVKKKTKTTTTSKTTSKPRHKEKSQKSRKKLAGSSASSASASASSSSASASASNTNHTTTTNSNHTGGSSSASNASVLGKRGNNTPASPEAKKAKTTVITAAVSLHIDRLRSLAEQVASCVSTVLSCSLFSALSSVVHLLRCVYVCGSVCCIYIYIYVCVCVYVSMCLLAYVVVR
jgi:hypothetical protein